MKSRNLSSFFVFMTLFGCLVASPAKAETTIGAQVLQSDLVLSKANSPYVVNGLIQIPAGVSLIIEPGSQVTFTSGGGIKSKGDIRIGSMSSTERVSLNIQTNIEFIGNGLSAPNISIYRTDLVGNESSLTNGCGKLFIDESDIENFSTIVHEQECVNLSIKNSYLKKVDNIYQGAFDGHPASFVMQNNEIDSMQSICCEIPDRTMGVGSSESQSSYIVSNNDFRNLDTLNIPYGYINYSFANNNLINVKNIKIVTYFGYIANSRTEVIPSNYWGGPDTDSLIRSSINVIDGKSDISKQRTITFEPVLKGPVQLTGFPIDKLKALDKAAADKAAADKAAADKAAADKAAADKAAADKAAADKAAADKAAADKAAADKAAADKAAADKAAMNKPKTITCYKGITLKKATGFNPKCPAGYSLRK